MSEPSDLATLTAYLQVLGQLNLHLSEQVQAQTSEIQKSLTEQKTKLVELIRSADQRVADLNKKIEQAESILRRSNEVPRRPTEIPVVSTFSSRDRFHPIRESSSVRGSWRTS